MKWSRDIVEQEYLPDLFKAKVLPRIYFLVSRTIVFISLFKLGRNVAFYIFTHYYKGPPSPFREPPVPWQEPLPDLFLSLEVKLLTLLCIPVIWRFWKNKPFVRVVVAYYGIALSIVLTVPLVVYIRELIGYELHAIPSLFLFFFFAIHERRGFGRPNRPLRLAVLLSFLWLTLRYAPIAGKCLAAHYGHVGLYNEFHWYFIRLMRDAPACYYWLAGAVLLSVFLAAATAFDKPVARRTVPHLAIIALVWTLLVSVPIENFAYGFLLFSHLPFGIWAAWALAAYEKRIAFRTY